VFDKIIVGVIQKCKTLEILCVEFQRLFLLCMWDVGIRCTLLKLFNDKSILVYKLIATIIILYYTILLGILYNITVFFTKLVFGKKANDHY